MRRGEGKGLDKERNDDVNKNNSCRRLYGAEFSFFSRFYLLC